MTQVFDFSYFFKNAGSLNFFFYIRKNLTLGIARITYLVHNKRGDICFFFFFLFPGSYKVKKNKKK